MRSSTQDQDHDLTEEADGDDRPTRSAARQARRRATWPIHVVLAAAMAAAGTGLLVVADDGGTAASDNEALVDTEATTKVIGDVSNAVTRIFTYTPEGTAPAERAAAESLAGQAATDYRRLIAKVRVQAPQQRLTQTTRVVRAGVSSLTEDTAKLLVFVDQSSTRAGQPNGTAAAAQLTITARLSDGRWKITELKIS
ncbi:hypothetical protein [Thermomonospora umbrina]|uniref:Mce-associated membrane protein n=1 Tax=Thermomonospora umbrina TaxID=111806 RepID=A0A3D9SZ13_9ACTN|nr:hypothetical protein [Thermomonospora umbrina]REE97814.1 Mce-associated membrane protein [Thermomonospora umbrina]